MADETQGARLSEQVLILLLGIVLGALTGFLQEVAKGEYAERQSRQIVRLRILPELVEMYSPERI